MKKIEYFYAGYSAFAYIGSAEFMRIAKTGGREIDHRPIDLRKVVAAASPAAFGTRTPQHMVYYFGREIERWAEHRGIPIMKGTPTHHSNDITLSNCMLIAGLVLDMNIDALAHEMLRAHWVDDYNLDNEADLARIATTVNLDPKPLLDAARSPEVKAIYQTNTEEAIARSIFGSPTYFVDGDMFYGQDHLDFVERAMTTAYKGQWPQ
ncbi:MAG: disulfide bond formation protein DsbA [Sneathiella sp.]|nr:MAG: disulfide bond formation protein DsbA [Sneathiella sp.]